MPTKLLERKFLDRVDKAPITFGDLSPQKGQIPLQEER